MGGVGRTMLEMLPVTNLIPKKYTKNIVIIEPKNLTNEPTIKNLIDQGNNIIIVQKEITVDNIDELIEKYILTNDIVIDVSYNIGFQPIIKHCFSVSAFYINTSMERFPVKNEHILEKHFYNRTLHNFHNQANDIEREMLKYNNRLSSVIVIHGMNPGLITHFVKLGLDKIAKQVIKLAKKYKIINKSINALKLAYKKSNYAYIAYILGLETIHCSERDTQITSVKRKKGEFINTWGAYSFYSEGVDPIQIGLGTHENIHNTVVLNRKKLPVIFPEGNNVQKNQIFSNVRGVDILFESYVPITNSSGKIIEGKNGKIIGMAISHSENDITNRYLSLYTNGKEYIPGDIKNTIKNKLLYRPSNYYVYSPCKDAWDSIAEVKKTNYNMLEIQHPLRGYEIKSGEDAVGALLIFNQNPLQKMLGSKEILSKTLSKILSDKLYDDIQQGSKSLWSGTILSIDEVKKMGFKYSGPTTIQVGASLISAINWMLKNPRKGLCYPENIPHQKILKHSTKWLGRIFCDFVPYNPKHTDLTSLSNF